MLDRVRYVEAVVVHVFRFFFCELYAKVGIFVGMAKDFGRGFVVCEVVGGWNGGCGESIM